MEDAEAARSGSEGVGLAAVVGGKDVDEAAMMFLAALARFESEPMMTIRVVEHRWRGNRGDVVAPVEGVPMECDDDRGRVEEAGSTEAAQLAVSLSVKKWRSWSAPCGTSATSTSASASHVREIVVLGTNPREGERP